VDRMKAGKSNTKNQANNSHPDFFENMNFMVDRLQILIAIKLKDSGLLNCSELTSLTDSLERLTELKLKLQDNQAKSLVAIPVVKNELKLTH